MYVRKGLRVRSTQPPDSDVDISLFMLVVLGSPASPEEERGGGCKSEGPLPTRPRSGPDAGVDGKSAARISEEEA